MNQDINYWIARCVSLEQELDMMKEQSIVKWQTGEPKKSGTYLVTIRGKYSIFVQSAQFGVFTGWGYFKPEEIIAWCKLSDIKPYKES